MCMMYVEGTKIEDPIIIGNNVNQQIIFIDNFKVFKFLYPVPNTEIDLVVYANIIDKAYYKISIAVDRETHTFYESRLTKSTPFYINNDQQIELIRLKCMVILLMLLCMIDMMSSI